MCNTNKHKDFCREPMYNKPVSDIPGVGIVLKRKLNNLGYFKARDLYEVLKSLGFSESKFYTWMKQNCSGSHFHSSYKALKEWHIQFADLDNIKNAAESEEDNNFKKPCSDRVSTRRNAARRGTASVKFNVREPQDSITVVSQSVPVQSSPWGSDPTSTFFFSMSETVKKFPRLMQSQIKSQVFEIINDADAKLAQDEDERTRSSIPRNSSELTRPVSQIDVE